MRDELGPNFKFKRSQSTTIRHTMSNRATMKPVPRTFPRPVVIGFHGVAGSGKKTACDILAVKYADQLNPQTLAFNNRLEDATRTMFGLPPSVLSVHQKDKPLGGAFAEGTSFRDLVISLGDMAKLLGGDDVFTRALWEDVEYYAKLVNTRLILISDARDAEHCQAIKDHGGLVVHLRYMGQRRNELTKNSRGRDEQYDIAPPGSVTVINRGENLTDFAADLSRVVDTFVKETNKALV